jgi:hypothetical protein
MYYVRASNGKDTVIVGKYHTLEQAKKEYQRFIGQYRQYKYDIVADKPRPQKTSIPMFRPNFLRF